jgi:3-(3-hydroxy-phenyl)propionate hydroxylase
MGRGAGSLAIQPRVIMQGETLPALLDDLTGPNFVLISPAPLPETTINAALMAEWQKIGGQAVAVGPEGDVKDGLKEEGRLFSDWMAHLQAVAVIVRPDRQVYGVARADGEVAPLVRSLLDRLR